MTCDMIWTGILTIPVAILQAIASCLSVICLSALAFGYGITGHTIYDLLVFLFEKETEEEMPWMYDLLMISVLISCYCFIVSALLCTGLIKQKIGYILPYVVCGVISLTLRASLTTRSPEFENFSNKNSIIYWAVYGLYIMLLIINIVEIMIKNRNKRGETISQYSQESKLDNYV